MHRPALLCLTSLGFILPACGSGPPPDPPPPDAPPPAACVVARVADGDTFTCRDGRRVRLLGVDTPELAQGDAGVKAHAALRRLLPAGTATRLELDVAHRDRYGRVLAYVWTGSLLVNESLVREGWAVLYTLPPNVKYVGRLGRAQKEARAGGAGLWQSGGFACAPSAHRRGDCPAPR